MNYHNDFHATVEAIASNPKITVAASSLSTSLAAAWLAGALQGTLALCSVAAGFVAMVLLARVHWATSKRIELEVLLLRKQVHDAGIDIGPDR